MAVREEDRSQTMRDVLETLEGLGYGHDSITQNVSVWLGDHQQVADVVGFGLNEPRDISTTTLMVYFAKTDALMATAWASAINMATSLASPIVGVAAGRLLSLAVLTEQGDTQPIADIDLGRRAADSALRELLNPRRILELKTQPRQTTLFPIDISILERARTLAEQRLTPRLENALNGNIEMLSDTFTPRNKLEILSKDELHQRAARLVVGALTTLVLRDKENLGNLTEGALLDTVIQRHPTNFKWVETLSAAELDGLTGTIAGLGSGVVFSGLDPLTLSTVYERALISDIRRNQLGTHYTPVGLARRLMSELPIEHIPPGTRTVLDPTCGSGGLLIAAHDRLKALQPTSWDIRQSHQDLAESLVGYDKDPFAVEIAKLSLLLHASPAGNGWDVQLRDALTTAIEPLARPSIIVANPPWRNSNREGGQRTELANSFLEWILSSLDEGGLLAAVMPIGWLDNRGSGKMRSKLRSECDLFEVWRLPQGTFDSANMAPAVLFAQKKRRPSKYTQVLFRRALTRGDLASFFKGIHETSSSMQDIADRPLDGPLIAGPLVKEFHDRPVDSLANVAQVVRGPQPLPNRVDSNRPDGNCLYLPGLGHLPAFGNLDELALNRLSFPNDFQTARGAVGLGRRKVVVPAASGPDTPWRLRSAIDRRGILTRDSTHMVIPNGDQDQILYALFAFLGSTFASCWIDETCMARNIGARHMMAMPFPSDPRTIIRLHGLGVALLDVGDGPDRAGLIAELDHEVWEGLAVSDSTRLQLQRLVANRSAPEGSPRVEDSTVTEGAHPSTTWLRFGSILAIEDGRILFDVPGVTPQGGSWMRPPPNFPAGMCFIGATFDVLVPESGSLEAGVFSYQSGAWLDDDTLWSTPAYRLRQQELARVVVPRRDRG